MGVSPGSTLDRVRPNTLFGFYAQDDYRATARLTLKLGLRYEFYTIPSERFGLDSALRNIFTDTSFTVGPLFARNPSLKNWAPRLGFAWDVNGDSRTALRGGPTDYPIFEKNSQRVRRREARRSSCQRKGARKAPRRRFSLPRAPAQNRCRASEDDKAADAEEKLAGA